MSAVDSFGFKMIKYGDNLTDVNRKATIAAALVYKSGVLSSAAGFTGGDRRFSKWKGKQGPALGAGFEVGGSKVHANALLKARPLGMWRLLESVCACDCVCKLLYGKRSGFWMSMLMQNLFDVFD
jgi:hypothetical protein